MRDDISYGVEFMYPSDCFAFVYSPAFEHKVDQVQFFPQIEAILLLKDSDADYRQPLGLI
jgi:hypothetical protein